MKTRIKLLVFSALFIACGPSWDNVIIHDNGVYEDPDTGACWVYDAGTYTPVRCPE